MKREKLTLMKSDKSTASGTFPGELERRLVLIYLGKSHHSSHVHEKVIEHLESVGPTARQLEALRSTAER